MSAIAGSVEFGGGEPARVNATMRAALDFVVADRMAAWDDGVCGLMVKRLIVHSRDRTAALLAPAESGIIAAIEGHLYNRPELAEALGLPRDSEDEELVSASWEKWGDSFPARLNGEFALAAWDARARRLLLAVDHVGTVPLYHTRTAAGGVAFGTELAPIVAATGRKPEPDWAKIADYLSDSLMEQDRTFIAGIAAVPPGCGAVFTAGGLRNFRYWDYAEIKEPRIRGVEEGVEAFRHALTRAVQRRLPEAGPVAAHLTGGLDSSSVAALAAEALRPRVDRLHLFSIVSHLPGEEGPRGDMDFIPTFLRDHPGCPHAYVREQIRSSYALPGLPNGPVNLQLTTAIEEMTNLACAAGCRAMLTGYGGEVAATYRGFGVHRAALKQGHWPWFWREMTRDARTWRDRVRWCRRWLRGPRMLREGHANRRWEILKRSLRPEFIAEYRVQERCFRAERTARNSMHWGQMRELDAMQKQGRLKDWAHHGRTAGFRYRYPLLDRELLSLSRRLPPVVHVHEGQLRGLMRKAMGGILPDEIARRDDPQANQAPPRMIEKSGSAELSKREETVWPFLHGMALSLPPADVTKPTQVGSPGNRLGNKLRHKFLAMGEFLSVLIAVNEHEF